MNGDRLFLDTTFVQALLDRRDPLNGRARSFSPRLDPPSRLVVTEAVLVEVGNALSAYLRPAAVEFLDGCYAAENVRVVPVDTPLLSRALRLYESRPDKMWGLTDCISFVVMAEQGLTEALTADRHFVQAGFRALLLEED